ncbi:hypothetical protein K461DRAFT_26646 [Myriangium duriaei CBS 260.36]|uniref:Uncharacterized protein n=1 Tax=Myriangium duriaei CBS 260.36 TaxID=1168546 RepID=A0A9P4JC45_9PEZI|nr:hypothetical protein K461DRAFT_26646 [Myriangium duriaei CBS 260.36]
MEQSLADHSKIVGDLMEDNKKIASPGAESKLQSGIESVELEIIDLSNQVNAMIEHHSRDRAREDNHEDRIGRLDSRLQQISNQLVFDKALIGVNVKETKKSLVSFEEILSNVARGLDERDKHLWTLGQGMTALCQVLSTIEKSQATTLTSISNLEQVLDPIKQGVEDGVAGIREVYGNMNGMIENLSQIGKDVTNASVGTHKVWKGLHLVQEILKEQSEADSGTAKDMCTKMDDFRVEVQANVVAIRMSTHGTAKKIEELENGMQTKLSCIQKDANNQTVILEKLDGLSEAMQANYESIQGAIFNTADNACTKFDRLGKHMLADVKFVHGDALRKTDQLGKDVQANISSMQVNTLERTSKEVRASIDQLRSDVQDKLSSIYEHTFTQQLHSAAQVDVTRLLWNHASEQASRQHNDEARAFNSHVRFGGDRVVPLQVLMQREQDTYRRTPMIPSQALLPGSLRQIWLTLSK